MKIKTSELIGKALDWAVWKIEHSTAKTDDELVAALSPFSPSSDWSQGGPIMERELIEWRKTEEGSINCWIDRDEEPGEPYGFGETLLIAAMRCYVNSKLGDEVDVPDELMGE